MRSTSMLLRATVAIAVINFVAYMIACDRLGGDAVNGRELDGRFFLMSHGKYTKVSRPVFVYSKVHTYSVWFTHASVFVVAIAGRVFGKREPMISGPK